MLKTKQAKKLLTKKEQRHLTESDIRSMLQMQRQVNFMVDSDFPCHECNHIAVKLGMVPEKN